MDRDSVDDSLPADSSAPLVAPLLRPDARSPAARMVLVYVVLGALWIVLGDWVLSEYRTAQGILFVALSGAVIWKVCDDAWRERARLADKHVHAQRLEAIGRLTRGIAHDYNNLLSVIAGYADLLQEGSLTEEQREDLRQIDAAARRARSLNQQLLAFGRQQPSEMATVDLGDVVRSTLDMTGRAMPAVEVEAALADDLEPVRGDRGQLEQVLMNLLMNAAEAMDHSGEVRVETSAVTDDELPDVSVPVGPGRYVRLRVVDDGPGMDDETLESVFEPFFTTKEEGTGLGLSTCYGIVKQHGGYIWAESAPGGGSTFDVYLPAGAAQPGGGSSNRSSGNDSSRRMSS